jgi:hypothetical protein
MDGPSGKTSKEVGRMVPEADCTGMSTDVQAGGDAGFCVLIIDVELSGKILLFRSFLYKHNHIPKRGKVILLASGHRRFYPLPDKG